MSLLSLEDVKAARARTRELLDVTPLAGSEWLGHAWGCDVLFKLENLQPTGSFKVRGALNKLACLSDEERTCGVVAASAGNHAQAVAYHARRLGIPATIVMPEYAPLVKVQNTEADGAHVVLHGAGYDDALEHARELSQTESKTFVHGFDDPWIIAGQGTVGLEILEQAQDLDLVVVPIGGGGLAAGIALAVKESSPQTKVVGVQFDGIPSMIAACEAGETVRVPSRRTIADGIAVCRVGELPLQLVKRYVDEVVTVTEEEIARAVLLLLEREKAVVEGAGAVGVAAIQNGRINVTGKRVAVILSGGNIDVTRISRIIGHGLAEDGRLARLRITVPDLPGELARILRVVAAARGNILEVDHDRAFSSAKVGETTIDITFEARGRSHIAEIRSQLEREGFGVTDGASRPS